MRAVAWLLVAFLAGCTGDPGVAEAPSGDAPLRLLETGLESDGLAWTLHGEGWGQRTVQVRQTTSFRLDHHELDLSSPFADDDMEYYGPGSYTVVHVSGADTHVFAWLGRTSGFSGATLDDHAFELTPGNWTVRVANNVPGYTIHLGKAEAISWTLEPLPGLAAGSPPGRLASGQDAGQVQFEAEYHFVAELPTQAASYIIAMGWGSESSVGPAPMAHAELAAAYLGLDPLGTPVSAGTDVGPGFGMGGYTGGAWWKTWTTEQTSDLQVAYAIRTTGAVAGVHAEGLTFVALPLA